MQQTKGEGSDVESLRRDDGRVHLYDCSATEAWIDVDEADLVEVVR